MKRVAFFSNTAVATATDSWSIRHTGRCNLYNVATKYLCLHWGVRIALTYVSPSWQIRVCQFISDWSICGSRAPSAGVSSGTRIRTKVKREDVHGNRLSNRCHLQTKSLTKRKTGRNVLSQASILSVETSLSQDRIRMPFKAYSKKSSELFVFYYLLFCYLWEQCRQGARLLKVTPTYLLFV